MEENNHQEVETDVVAELTPKTKPGFWGLGGLLNKKTFGQLVRYGSVTAVSYVFLIFGTYALVEWVGWSSSIAYLVVLTVNYIGVYFAQTKFIFAVAGTRSNFTKYVIVLVIFWLFNNFFYNIMVEFWAIQYLLAVVINIVLFGAIRFLIYKKLVFKT